MTVLYTSIRPTLAALRQAASLARDLEAVVRILHVRTVPYPLPIDQPPADREILSRKICTLAEGQPIPTRVEICYGRDFMDSLLQSLSPNSIVLIGLQRMHWWSKERRWARLLSNHGHQIVFVSDR